VIFQGFKAYLGPHNAYWASTNSSWAVQFACYTGILVFLLLLGISRLVLGADAFQWRNFEEDEMLDGGTGDDDEPPPREVGWTGIVSLLLDFI
jgi:hypothetical protein